MDFAKRQLQKYGWQEGKGLGKTEHGIKAPILPKLKFDNAGIGHSPSEQFTNNWWENLYNKASSNVDVQTKKGKVKIQVKEEDAVEISTKSYSLKNLKKENNLEYGNFIKTSKLTETGMVDLESSCRKLSLSDPIPKAPIITDAELFAMCGGRTAHKGARHGLKLNGKLSRLEKQEKLLLKKLKATSITDANTNKKSLEKKLKKLDYIKNKEICENVEKTVRNNVIPESTTPLKSNKSGRKHKKERKRVSFCETVTEYQTFDSEPGTSDNLQNDDNAPVVPPVVTKRQAKLKDKTEHPDNNANLVLLEQDEGIDCPEIDSAMMNDAQDQLEVHVNKRKIRNFQLIEPNTENSNSKLQCAKRKIKLDIEDCDKKDSKKRYYDCKRYIEEWERVNAKRLKKMKKEFKKDKLEKKINSVTDTLNQVCKISDTQTK